MRLAISQRTSLFIVERREASRSLPDLTSSDLPGREQFREAVLQERWLEFPFEGQRWFDLIRTRSAVAQIDLHQGISMQSHQYLYPIPQKEIEKMHNPSIFPQNPEY